jgi:cytoskeletal protein CcmA (bactofilin family)
MMLETDFKNINYSIIGKDNHLLGEIQIQGDLYVYGKVKGDLIFKTPANLILERTSNVEGRIFGFNIEIHGQFSGTIQSQGVVKIYAGANVSGNIKSNQLVVYPGAILNSESQVENSTSN